MSDHYSRMLADKDRIHGFRDAIQKAVRPDDVVVDLGCGVGTFAMLASRAGARRVFGVEKDPVIDLARQIAEHNELKVEYLAGDARDIQLPEPATLLIFEDYATGLLDGLSPRLLEHAREHWVADAYRVMPHAASLQLAPISSTNSREQVFPLGSTNELYCGFDFRPLVESACNSMFQIRGASDLKLLAPPAVVLEHCFSAALPTSWSTQAVFEFDQEAVMDGVCLWHDLHLDQETTYSNHPDHPTSKAIWGQYLFSMPQSWTVTSGSQLKFDLMFQRAFDDGFWKWKFELVRGGDGSVDRFSGNTFASSPVTGSRLPDYSVEDIVQLTERAKLELLILSLVDGQRTIDEIYDEVKLRCDQLSRTQIIELVHQSLENRRARQPADQGLT